MPTPVWEDYNLKSFSLGVNRLQPSPFVAHKPFNGTVYIEAKTPSIYDLPASWQVRLQFNADQVESFKLLYAEAEINDRQFVKELVTEVGVNTHTLTFAGPEPMFSKVAYNLWEVTFQVYSPSLNLEFTPLAGGNDDGGGGDESPWPAAVSPTTWEQTLPRYLDTGSTSTSNSFWAVDASGDMVLYVTSGGYGSKSIDGAENFTPLARGFGHAPTYPKALCAAMSADGSVSFIGCGGGYASVSRDSMQSFIGQTRGLANTGDVSGDIEGCCMSDDGLLIYAIHDNGYLSYSRDAGVNWQLHPDRGLGTSATIGLRMACSADGQIVFAGFYGGYCSISYDGGDTWNAMTQNLGGSVGSNVASCAMSKDGMILYVGFANGELAISTNEAVGFVVLTTAQVNTGGTGQLYAIACSADGSTAVFTHGAAFCSYTEDFGSSFIRLPQTLGTGYNGQIDSFATNGALWLAAQPSGWAADSRG